MDINVIKNKNKSFNKGKRYVNALIGAIKKLGCARSIVVDKHYNVICGDKTLLAAKAAGITNVAVVETTGDTLVVVKRVDVETGSTKALDLSLVDNLSTDQNLTFDTDLLVDTMTDNDSFNPQSYGAHQYLVKELTIEDLLKQDVARVNPSVKRDNIQIVDTQLTLF